jgi:hypothetical protein
LHRHKGSRQMCQTFIPLLEADFSVPGPDAIPVVSITGYVAKGTPVTLNK